MSKKLLVCLSLLVVLSLVIVGAASSCAPKETKILRLSMPLPEFDPTSQDEIAAAEKFNEAAKGAYKIEVHCGGVLAGQSEGFDMVREGAIELCDFSPDLIAGKDLLFATHNMPFTLNDGKAAQRFLELIREAVWQDRLREKYNVELLAVGWTGCHDWSGTKPVHTMEDWKGVVVWVSNPMEAEAMQLLGASPVTLDWVEGYPAIEKGVVDGCVYGRFATWMLKWEVCRYLTVYEAFHACGGVCINLDVYNSLPKNLQEALHEAYGPHSQWLANMFEEQTLVASEELVANGVEIYYLPDAERAKWAEVTKPVVDKYWTQLSPADAKLIQDLLAEANQ